MMSELESKRLDKAVEITCVEAAKEANAVAALYGTTVVIEKDGETIEVEPSESYKVA